jgi:poly(A) polymerase Pap1
VLQNFFVLWSTWPWPQPVGLLPPSTAEDARTEGARPHDQRSRRVGASSSSVHQEFEPPLLPAGLQQEHRQAVASWNPVFSPGLMPVVTPIWPTINSSHQLTLSTAQAIQHELRRAAACDNIAFLFHPRLMD